MFISRSTLLILGENVKFTRVRNDLCVHFTVDVDLYLLVYARQYKVCKNLS